MALQKLTLALVLMSNLTLDMTLCAGQEITLKVNDFFDTFTWVPEDGLSCDDCASVTIQPDETTEYRVIGTSDLDCITVDTFEVKINSWGIEICDNGIDDDDDGLIDCYDPDCCNDAICNDFYYDDCPVDCEFTPANTSFQMEEEWRYDAGNWHSYNTAITGDVDGDGVPEVIGKTGPYTFSGDNHNDLLVINGQTGNLEATISTPSMMWSVDAVAIADINRNGFAEIIMIAANENGNGTDQGHLHCYEFDGAQYQLLWRSDTSIDTNFGDMLWSPNIADFDGDGNAEIYVSHQIFNGLTGQLLVTGGNNNRGILADDAKVQTVAVDVLPNDFCPDCSGLELVAGNQVYSVSLANTNMNVEVQASGARDGFVGIADMDRDGDLDAVIVYAQGSNANVYIWDIQTPNQLGTTHTFNSTNFGIVLASQPNIADIDDNGTLDIGICGVQTYRFLTLNANSLDLMWMFNTSDNSGNTGSTIFDFEGDGDKEIVYRDEDNLRIFDATGNTLLSAPCSSGTSHEYPVIVDVDADGETELLCSCNNQVRAYGSASTPWIATRPVWNQHAYFNVNINDDLTVPPSQQQHHIVGDSMVLNNFLTQYSDLEFPVADATISVENANCAADELEVSIEICNIGDNTLSFETPITFYDNNPTQTSANPLTTLIIGQNIEVDSCLTQNYIIPSLYNQQIYVIINDDASLNPVFSLENDFPVTAIAECDFTNNIDNFIVPLTAPMLDLGADTTACDAINYTLNAGGDFVTYQWQDGSTDSTFTVTDAGMYSVSVTDICGNIQTDNINVIIENCCQLTVAANPFNIDCANESGSITTVVTDGQMPYTYAWTNGADTPDIYNLDAGIYTVTVTDNAGCTATATTEITATLFQLNISTSEDTICMDESTNLTASGAQYYEWTPADGLSNLNIPNPIATPNVTTTYIVNGYERTDNLITNGDFEQGNTGFTSEYNHNPNPPTGFLPEGDYAITDSPANVHQNFFDCDDHSTGTGNMMVVNGDTTTNQSLWCQSVNVQTNTNYDFSTWVATVFPDAPAVLQFSINATLLGAPFTASNTACVWAEFNEIWNSGNNTTATICIVNQNTIEIGNDFALDDITFSTLCTATDSVTIYVSDVEAIITDSSVISCDDPPCTGSATASGIGGFIENDYTYEWSNGQTTATATDLCAGVYNVTVTDDVNCSAVATVEITEEEGFTLAANVLTQITCPGVCNGSASVTVTGGTMPFTYTWNNGATTADISGLCEGMYAVTVTDANDCQDTTSIQINTLSTLALSDASSTPVSCFEGNNGTATASATGGTPPYTYAWSTGATTETIDSLLAGIYTIVISDASGCSLPPVNITVTEPATPVALTVSGTNPTCNGLSNGTATALPEGGTASYDYMWSEGSSTQTALNLPAGSYAVTVTDANGCTATADTNLSEPTEITASISTENPVCFGANTGSILVENPSGGFAPYTYSLDGEIYQTENSFSGLAAGTYSVYVQDTEACVNTFDAVITQPVELLVNLGVDITVELSDSTQLFAQSNSSDTLTYQWTPANGLSCINCAAPTVYILDTETYSVTVTDAEGCTATDDIIVNINKNRNIFIPNVFSPDNDGTNDLFMIYGGKGVVGIIELQIYDRWGNLIFVQNNFQPDDPAMAWDGTFRGQTMSPQVFVYHAEIEFIDGISIPYKGDITLVK